MLNPQEQDATTRRNFLTDCAKASTLALGTGVLLTNGLFTNTARAASPCVHKIGNKSSHMKLSLAAYSFHSHLARHWPLWRKPTEKAEMSMFDFIDFCASLNLDGCELTSYYFPAKVTDEYLAKIKRATFVQGLDISGTAIGNDFCFPEGTDDRKKNIAMTKTWIDYAAQMGAPVIRVFAGYVKKGTTEEEAIALAAAGINECLVHAAKKGVILALENHGGITETPKQMMKILEAVKPSPFFGVNFDSGNFRTADPYGDLEKIAPYAVNAQIKVDISPNKRGNNQDADIPRIVKILKQANYRGYIVLEYERHKDEKKKESIANYIKQLRELIS